MNEMEQAQAVEAIRKSYKMALPYYANDYRGDVKILLDIVDYQAKEIERIRELCKNDGWAPTEITLGGPGAPGYDN